MRDLENERKRAFDAVIVANGDFPTHATPLAVLQGATHVVACDGAAAHFSFSKSLHLSFSQSLIFSFSHSLNFSFSIVGDGDSVPDAYRDRLIQIDEQDDNDLTKATRYCLQQGWHRIAYLGGTGKREDHTLGNIALLMRYFRDMGVEPVMWTDHGCFTPACGDRTFAAFAGQQVSLFNFGCSRLTSEGLKWEAYPYKELWQGTLNESLATAFTIRADGCYLVYQTYEPKR